MFFFQTLGVKKIDKWNHHKSTTPVKTNMAMKNHIFYSKYIFIHGVFSIFMSATKKILLLSIESCLINRDPYYGLSKSPHSWVVCVVSPPIWVFPTIGVPQNGWFIMENPIKMDDSGVSLFSETSIYPKQLGCFFSLFIRSFSKV